ncbi:hypothetical protein KIS4809_1767 [Bacillus sp. ZZV12-4809]|nr:hypothetical protein KIS4809_1767 [Bacillus sp. ZZV12-4809]
MITLKTFQLCMEQHVINFRKEKQAELYMYFHKLNQKWLN